MMMIIYGSKHIIRKNYGEGGQMRETTCMSIFICAFIVLKITKRIVAKISLIVKALYVKLYLHIYNK